MTSPSAMPLSIDPLRTRTTRVRIDLVVPRSPLCARCEAAIEEIDDAAALLAPELAARGAAVQVRVTTLTRPGTPGPHGARPLLELRVNGVVVEPHGTQGCGDRGPGPCGTYEWDGARYATPPAELLAAVIHEHLDRDERGYPVG